MTQASQTNNLPTILAALRQEGPDGELVLEQNDGTRRLYWRRGELVYLQSDVAGEQFGNYLLRRGILDLAALNKLLANDERFRLGEKVVQWGMMSLQERDAHLQLLQEQVMINALEHPIISLAWNPGPVGGKLSEDLQLKLDHRHFIWATFLEAHVLQETYDLLADRSEWRWTGCPGLLEAVSDLPLDPATAYALSFLGSEPISCETFLALSDLPEPAAVRVLLSLWAVGALTLAQGELPTPALQVPPAPALPPTPPTLFTPFTPMPPMASLPPAPVPVPAAPQPVPPPAGPVSPAAPEPEPEPMIRIELDDGSALPRPEFLATEEPTPDEPMPALEPATLDASPVGRARGLHRKARQLNLQDRTGEAIRCLELSVQLDPSSNSAYEVWLLLGRLRMGNPAWATRAINALQAASRIKPKAAEPWVAMGEVYFRKAFRTNAWACFHKALELDPSVPIPPEVDLRTLEPPPVPEPAPPATLFSRFKSILGGSDRK